MVYEKKQKTLTDSRVRSTYVRINLTQAVAHDSTHIPSQLRKRCLYIVHSRPKLRTWVAQLRKKSYYYCDCVSEHPSSSFIHHSSIIIIIHHRSTVLEMPYRRWQTLSHVLAFSPPLCDVLGRVEGEASVPLVTNEGASTH